MNIQDVLDRVRPGNIYDFHILRGSNNKRTIMFVPMSITMPSENVLMLQGPNKEICRFVFSGQLIVYNFESPPPWRLVGITLVQEVT